MDNKFLKSALLTAIAANFIVTPLYGASREITISEAELIKFRYLLSGTDLTLDQVIKFHMKNGTIRIESGKVKLNISNYDLLKEKRGIDRAQSSKATLCTRSGTSDE